MKSLAELVESKGYKKLMTKVYGWGAAVVLMGALFKIQHWPGATEMLIVGMGTEVIIFFLSAFEPLHEELDWTLVYPELAGLTEDEDIMDNKPVKTKRSFEKVSRESMEEGGNSQGVSGQFGSGSGQATGQVTGQVTGNVTGSIQGNVRIGSTYALERFDELLEKSNLGTELFDKLGEGLNNFSKTASKLADISNAATASDDFVKNLNSASKSVGQFADKYDTNANSLEQALGQLTQSYMNSAEAISNSGSQISGTIKNNNNQLADTYKTLIDALNTDINSIKEVHGTYSEKLGSMNKQLSAINAIYELQLQSADSHLKATNDLYNGVDKMMDHLKQSVDETQRYRDEIARLSQSLASLNSVYGNMLTAMNSSN